jgi:hypothetical protein
MNNLASIFNDQGRNVEAILLLENIVQVGKQVFGPQHPNMLSSSQTVEKLAVYENFSSETF